MQFDMLRACFWLLAFVVAIVMATVFLGVIGCGILALRNNSLPGTCITTGLPQIMHDWWAEILTAVLALIAAASGRLPPPPPPPGPPAKG
jgi:hypothetical protein